MGEHTVCVKPKLRILFHGDLHCCKGIEHLCRLNYKREIELVELPSGSEMDISSAVAHCDAVILGLGMPASLRRLLLGLPKPSFCLVFMSADRDGTELPKSFRDNVISFSGQTGLKWWRARAGNTLYMAEHLLRRYADAMVSRTTDVERQSPEVCRTLDGTTWLCVGADPHISFLLPHLLVSGVGRCIIDAAVFGAERFREWAAEFGVTCHHGAGRPKWLLRCGSFEMNIVGAYNYLDLLPAADVVSIHGNAPRIDAHFLAKTKRGVAMVNAAGAGSVDGRAVEHALSQSHLGGYADDVSDADLRHCEEWAAVNRRARLTDNAGPPVYLTLRGGTGSVMDEGSQELVSELLARLGGAGTNTCGYEDNGCR